MFALFLAYLNFPLFEDLKSWIGGAFDEYQMGGRTPKTYLLNYLVDFGFSKSFVKVAVLCDLAFGYIYKDIANL